MKAADFDLRREIRFDPEAGITSFRNTRLLLFDANAMGLLRHELCSRLGDDEARAVFLRFGFQHGYADFMQMRVAYDFDSDQDLLASGPVIHTWQGLVQATPTRIEYNRDSGEFFFTGIWSNSYEAQQHLSYNRTSDRPVCWSLMGYASGWCTAFFGHPLLAIEPVCMGMGHDHCEWKVQPPEAWGDEGREHLEVLSDLLRIGG